MSANCDKDGPAGAFQERARQVSLRPPDLPGPGPALAPAPVKYPALQELAARRQEIKDAFSKLQLELCELKRETAAGLPPPTPSAVERAPAVLVEAGKYVPAAPDAPGLLEEEPAGTRRGRYAAWAAVAVAVLAAFALSVWLLNTGQDSVITLPPASASGLCADGKAGSVFFIDPMRQLLISVSLGDKRVKAMQSFHSPGMKALACDGQEFWSSDGKNIYSHAPLSGHPVKASYKAAGALRSLCLDEGTLWAVSEAGKLYAYRDGVLKVTFDVPGPRGSLSCVSEGRLWVLDPEKGRLAVFDAAQGMRKLAETNVKSALPKGRLAGMAVAGKAIWVITQNPAELAFIGTENMKF